MKNVKEIRTESVLNFNFVDDIEKIYINSVQNKNVRKHCRQFLNDLYVSCGAEKMSFTERQIIRLSPNLKYTKDIHYVTQQFFPLKCEEIPQLLLNKIEESMWKNHELLRYFKPECALQEGQKLESLPDLEKLGVDKSSKNYNLDGRIYFIYIWTIYKPVCKKQLKDLNSVLMKYPGWDGKFKILSINTDLNRESAVKLIKSLSLSKIEHYYFNPNSANHPLLKTVNLYGYPFCILVNDNFIEFCGSLYDLNLEEKVYSLLNQQQVAKVNVKDPELEEKESKALKDIVGTLQFNCEKYKNDLFAPFLCGATIKITKTFKAAVNNNFLKKQVPSTANISITKGFTRSDKQSATFKVKPSHSTLSSFLETPKIKKNYTLNYEIDTFCHPDDQKTFMNFFLSQERDIILNMNKSLVHTVEILPAEVNTECLRCKKEVLAIFNFKDQDSLDKKEYYIDTSESDDVIILPHYFCLECRVYFCKKCGDAISNLNSHERIHPHFLYLISGKNKRFLRYVLAYNNENSYEFDFKYFQQNRKTDKFIEDVKYHYQVKCDGCLAFPIRSVRWKCCNCVFKNICDSCKYNLDFRVSPEYENILDKFAYSDCDPEHHVFMKIIFDSFVF